MHHRWRKEVRAVVAMGKVKLEWKMDRTCLCWLIRSWRQSVNESLLKPEAKLNRPCERARVKDMATRSKVEKKLASGYIFKITQNHDGILGSARCSHSEFHKNIAVATCDVENECICQLEMLPDVKMYRSWSG